MPNSAAISKNNAFGAWRRILPAVVSLSLLNCAQTARIDAWSVFHAVKNFSGAYEHPMIRFVYAARDGTVWIVARDYWGVSDTLGRSTEWHVRRLDSDGSPLGGDMPVFPRGEREGRVNSVSPVGTTPEGDLVVDIREEGSEGRQRLAKISASGATAISGVMPPHGPHEPFVFIDRDAIAHLILGHPGPAEYAQVNMAAKGMPIIRTLDYEQPFNGYSSAPAYLRWRPWERGLLAFHSEGRSRMMAATLTPTDSFASLHLYRVNSRTLSLTDSGAIHRTDDAYRAWSGPVIRLPIIVPADKSGFWVFTPTGDSPPAPTVVAYRIRPDLKVVRPTAVEADEARRFDAAPTDAVVSIECPYHPPRWLDSGGVRFRLVLDFTAFGSDGRLYAQTFQDSVISSRPE